LEQIVLEELRELLHHVPKHEKLFARHAMAKSAQEYKLETAAKKQAAEKYHSRQKVEIIYNNIGEVDRLVLKGLRT